MSHRFLRRRLLDEATGLLLAEIRARLGYLADVGLGYLTLDRQSRTLSGGEVQRINLTTALGTSLVNTLFVVEAERGDYSTDADVEPKMALPSCAPDRSAPIGHRTPVRVKAA